MIFPLVICRDGTGEISRDPRTNRLPTQWGRLATHGVKTHQESQTGLYLGLHCPTSFLRGSNSPRKDPYLSTVPNLAGQSRFQLHCPAVPQSTPPVPILFVVAASVYSPRPAARAQETAGHARTFLLPCLHEQWRLTIFYIAMQAGMCVICLHTKNGLDRSHTERMFSVASSAHAHIFVPIFGQKFPNLHKCGPSLCS